MSFNHFISKCDVNVHRSKNKLKCMTYDIKFFTCIFKRAFRVMKNCIYFIVITFFVAESFKVLHDLYN